ncbi:MAG: DUF4118 domain-containing protein, partial [Bryobacteraceae bacterium]
MGRFARYGLAFGSVALVVCLKLYFARFLGEGVPFLLFFGPVVLTASYAGKGPALAATVFSAAAANYFFVAPLHGLGVPAAGTIQTIVFVVEGVLISEFAARWRQSETEARLQTNLLRTTLLSIGDAVVATDAAGRVTLMNPVAEELTGFGQEEAEGKPLDNVFRIINEGTREIMANPLLRVLETGEIAGLANHTLLISRKGDEIPIDDSGAPIRGSDGVLAGAVLVFRNITERRNAAREIEEAARRLSSVLENIGDGFAILD